MRLTEQRVGILAAVALVIISATILVNVFSGTSESGFTRGSRLLEGFDPDIVSKITIVKNNKGADPDKVTIVRDRGKYYVADIKSIGPDKEEILYPASVEKINKLITDCDNIRLATEVSASSESHSELQVSENSDDSLILKFIDKKDQVLTGLVKGKSASTGGSHVRLVNDDKVYTSEGWISADYLATDYIDKKLTDFSQDDITSVEVNLSGGSYVIQKDKDGSIVLKDVPKGKQGKSSDVKSVFGALAGLSFDKVLPLSEAETRKLKWDTAVTCELKGRYQTWTARLAKTGGKKQPESKPASAPSTSPAEKKEDAEEEKFYIRISVKGLSDADLEKAIAEANRIANKHGATKEEMAESAKPLDGRKQALELAEFHAPWVYEISTWDAKKMRKSMSELLEDYKPPATRPAGIPGGHPTIRPGMKMPPGMGGMKMPPGMMMPKGHPPRVPKKAPASSPAKPAAK